MQKILSEISLQTFFNLGQSNDNKKKTAKLLINLYFNITKTLSKEYLMVLCEDCPELIRIIAINKNIEFQMVKYSSDIICKYDVFNAVLEFQNKFIKEK